MFTTENRSSSSTPGGVVSPGLSLFASSETDYRSRTITNARSADVTVAFAVDFSTSGERLTASAAGDRLVRVHLPLPDRLGREHVATAARDLYRAAGRFGRRINVAGNGLATLSRHGWTQAMANGFVYDVLSLVHSHMPLLSVRSGGQTGFDTAGLVAGVGLGISTVGLFPRGFRQRDASGKEIFRSKITLQSEIIAAARALHATRLSADSCGPEVELELTSPAPAVAVHRTSGARSMRP